VAASPRPPSWAIENTEFNAGVRGETAPALAGRRRAVGFGVMSCEGWVTRVADWSGRYLCVRQWFLISQRGCRCGGWSGWGY